MVDFNDHSLLSSINICADKEAYRNAREMLKLMQMPNPEDAEYYCGDNVDRIYLNTHGLAISFVYRVPTVKGMVSQLLGKKDSVVAPIFEARKVVDERILQPLHQIDLSAKACLEIVPGIEHVGAKPEDIKELSKNLKQKLVHFFNPAKEFVGMVRTPHGEEDLMVVANRRAIMKMSGPDAGSGAAKLQERVYGALRQQIGDAFQSASADKVAKALDECQKIASLNNEDSARILYPHWKDTELDSARRQRIRSAARNYERRLTQ